MRLSTITNWAYGATVVLTLASATTMLLASGADRRERDAVAERYALDSATAHVDEDIATLSDLARHYAISGNPADLVAYRQEAGTLATIEQRTAHIRDAGASVEEIRDLHQAMHWADALQAQQHAAIAARDRDGRTAAITILFAPEYQRELERIQGSVDHFQERIDQRTAAAVDGATAASRLWRTMSEIVLALTGLLFLFVLYFIFRRRVLRPVVKLSDVVTRLAAQDYDAEPPEYERVDEIGDMAQALRIFRDNGIARQRLEQERDADRSLRDLLSRMTQRLQRCDDIADLSRVVQRFVPEVVPALAGRLYLLDQERNVLVEACSWLDPRYSRAEFVPTACWAVRRGSEHRATGAAVDVPCAHVLPGDDRQPETICLPLAAQAGVVGLLYFELRDGFSTTGAGDVHLKMLAENIGLALDNLRLRDALRILAMADPLTTLANRRHLDAVLGNLDAKPDHPISCIMLDVDHFKRFNDEYGHEAGDAVLRAIGATLRAAVRQGDLAFRYGGEEFLLLLSGADPRQALDRAEELRHRVADLRLQFGGRQLGPLTISAGIATAPQHCPADRLVETADAALLEAKRTGRNRVVMAARENSSGRINQRMG
ncbi:diguanylate cyclase [Hephaestia mangrovi]|uniref:diguanylate cyclase n=1 Tax=Hephaestia mangrovi TaxID=2873268 RepID=UPI001CA7172E|nr:diguanylate cyclase [Hephaestia mangrovi]MBY8829838.1 diguanylate cyclase [Hephaestia mangrovi]